MRGGMAGRRRCLQGRGSAQGRRDLRRHGGRSGGQAHHRAHGRVNRSRASHVHLLMKYLWLVLLVGCGGSTFELESARLVADADLEAGADDGVPDVGADRGGEPEAGVGDGGQDAVAADSGQLVGDSCRPSDAASAPTDCPRIVPPGIEVWTVYPDGGFAPQAGGDCQGSQLPVGDSYTCASIMSNWTCPWQPAQSPSILRWCRVIDGLVVMGCEQP